MPVGDTITVAKGQTLSHIAVKYGVTVDQLKEVNGLQTSAIKAGQNIVIPLVSSNSEKNETKTASNKPEENYETSKLNYMENKIQAKYKELEKAKTPEAKAKIEKEIKELKEKQKKQKETADIKLDDEQDYILITMKTDMNVEELKKLFDIKDGAIRAHNDLDYRFIDYEEGTPQADEGRQYKDYSHNVITAGQTIKVRPSEVNNQGALKEFWNWITN